MTASFWTVLLWAALVLGSALAPSRFHRLAAWGLIGAGVPILGWMTYQNGLVPGFLTLAGGALLLRGVLDDLCDQRAGLSQP